MRAEESRKERIAVVVEVADVEDPRAGSGAVASGILASGAVAFCNFSGELLLGSQSSNTTNWAVFCDIGGCYRAGRALV